MFRSALGLVTMETDSSGHRTSAWCCAVTDAAPRIATNIQSIEMFPVMPARLSKLSEPGSCTVRVALEVRAKVQLIRTHMMLRTADEVHSVRSVMSHTNGRTDTASTLLA